MPADLFPGFDSHWIDLPDGRFFARAGGPAEGPPVLLLHGFPQTHACWHRVAPALARRHRVICLDLKGYGWSAAPKGDPAHEAYSKRRMGEEAVAVMERLGHARFALVGHDRGGRVGYRLALDHPGRVARLALLDILPTLVQWRRIEADPALYPHWRFLAEPAPGPETRIGRGPDAYYEGLLRGWTGDGTLDAFAPGALALYRQSWSVPERIHAMCEDYRAGAGPDRAADEADLAAGRTLACPTLILPGTGFVGRGGLDPVLGAWRETFAPAAAGAAIASGHFVAEENPEETLRALVPFLRE
ncbi:alpha/beta hydrolase fold [Methylobacterium sp. 4-46]|uniref:alpha/beta fold hydrolase n=1 Tax=unclassified Methylobacterium TaxID=2615210 RepID=UPI000152DF7F|nr:MULTISPECIES: alpha/beta hydrolase [Methylobacterium]ACA20338.1 alpha/beta hydrolase fold [Methylobacterium sp. 4-46]WFT79509.1 alpha/beta hydrolase [Methylobacterium nodulans]